MARGHVRKRQLKRPRRDGCRFVWDAWIDIPPEANGRRRLKSKKGFPQRRDAAAWIAEQIVLSAQGTAGSPGTVRQLLDQWLDSKTTLKPSTRASYRRHVDHHLRPICNVDASTLTSPDLLITYATLLDSGLSGTTVRSVHATVRACLGWAVRHGKLARNVATSITSEDLPRRSHVEMCAWSGSEVLAILEASREEFRPLFAVIARTGARRGEALALRWSDIDEARMVVTIERSFVPRPGGGLDIVTPKTRGSRRAIDVTEAVLIELAEVRRRQVEQRLISGERPGSYGDLVFTREDGVTPLSPGVVSREFHKAVRRAKVRPGRLHDLRHSFATIALTAGVPVIIVSRALGHTQPSTTLNVYGHLLAGTSGQATAAVDAALATKPG